MKNFQFTLEYNDKNLEDIDRENYFETQGHLPFDTYSQKETYIMMCEVSKMLHIFDAYSLKKLEIVLRYELPFFVTNRRLVRNWLMDNFIY
jgi:hypothetical protein